MLMDIYGAYPTAIGHTKEYVPFWQGKGVLSDDAFLELRCDVDIHGPRPQPFGEFPRGVLALQNQVLDTHELTAQAAVECDRDILLRAFMTDPIINSISDGKKIMEELLEAEKDTLPAQWYK